MAAVGGGDGGGGGGSNPMGVERMLHALGLCWGCVRVVVDCCSGCTACSPCPRPVHARPRRQPAAPSPPLTAASSPLAALPYPSTAGGGGLGAGAVAVIVIAVVAILGGAGYLAYQYRIRSIMQQEVRAILAQYMHLPETDTDADLGAALGGTRLKPLDGV